jgi:hypothetical protein
MNIIVGSLTAFVVGQLVDAFLFRPSSASPATSGSGCAPRAAPGEPADRQRGGDLRGLLDLQGHELPMATALVLTAYTYKLIVAVLSTPLVYLVHAGVERYLGKERAQPCAHAALRGKDEQ